MALGADSGGAEPYWEIAVDVAGVAIWSSGVYQMVGLTRHAGDTDDPPAGTAGPDDNSVQGSYRRPPERFPTSRQHTVPTLIGPSSAPAPIDPAQSRPETVWPGSPRANPSQANRSQASPPRADSLRVDPSRADPSRANASRADPSRTAAPERAEICTHYVDELGNRITIRRPRG